MRLLISAALLLAALILPGGAAEVGPETLLSKAESVPWRGVGRVNIAHVRRRGLCTGALIEPDVVLTAAHCVINQRTGQPYPAGDIHFVAGWHKGDKTGHSRAAALAVHPDYKVGRKQKARDLGGDVALIRLRNPLPRKAAETFAPATPPLPGDPLTIVSYRRDRPHALTYQTGCPYGAIFGTVLVIDCPVIEGASGSPVFVEGPDGAVTVVAVIVARGASGSGKAYAVRADLSVALLRPVLP